MKPILCKPVFVLLILLTGFTNMSLAQTSIWSVDAAKNLDKLVTFDEYVNKVNYNPVTKTCLIKLSDPDIAKSPTITVVIHHISKTKHLLWLKNLEGHTINVTGKLLSIKGEFEINGNDLRTKIKDEKDVIMTDPMPIEPQLDTAYNQ